MRPKHQELLRTLLFASVVASIANSAVSGEARPTVIAQTKPSIGEKVGEFSFKDIRHLPRTLSDLVSKKDPTAKRGFVLVFTNTTCPLVQKYLPRLKSLDEAYRERGIQFVAVNVGADDSILQIAAQAVKHEAAFPFVKDINGSCVRACGVERTPEAVLLDAEHRLRYRGRIDDQYRLGGTLPAATRQELRDAIESLLAGREIEVAESPVDGCKITSPRTPKSSTELTFVDVSGLFTQHCQSCHREGTSAPFSLNTYDEISAHREMIAEVVDERRMPPWYASEEFGTFTNCHTLPDADRDRMLEWLHAGAPQGNLDDIKTTSTDEAKSPWLLGEPDLILTNSISYKVPAEGYVDYKYAVLPSVVWHDTWIQGAEVLPDNPRVLHHCNMGYVTAGGLKNSRLVTGYVPGGGPLELKDGVAIMIPAGSLLALQIHFTTTGKPEKCGLKVGFRYAKETVQKRLQYLELSDQHFTVPPFASFHPVKQSGTIDRDITATGLFAHMHVRGKDVTFLAFPPQAEPETMLLIPNYNFDWQMPYFIEAGKKRYPAGTQFECLAHFDNSTFNPYNPDPSVTVQVGDQTVNEMMYGFMFYTEDAEQLNLKIDPQTGREMN